MILYIDTFISEIALCPNRKLEAFLEKVQQNSYVYRKQSKIDIFKYSAASYVSIPWSKVILRIDGDIKEDIVKLKGFLEECFPDADLLFERNDTGSKYASVLDGIRKDNPWIFFSPNNDHPFIYKDAGIFDNLISAAEKAEAQNNIPVTILYSHFTESINSISPSGYLYGYTGDFCKVVDEDEFSYTVKYDHVSLASLQIFRAEYLYKMMRVAGENRVIRTECLGEYTDYNTDSLVIIPKVECCRHYDAYMHTSFVIWDFITSSRVPPLFIPDNFFDKKIKIKYGFDKYYKGFVNINPFKKSYSFNSKNGTDLALFQDEIPSFWNGRIESFEVNQEIDKLSMEESWLSMEIKNPWRYRSKSYIKLIILYRKFHFNILMPLVGNGYKKVRGFLSMLKKKYYSN
jgi:hypothetical protein